MQTNTDHIIRDCCEAEVAEFGKPDTICITVDDLREIVQRHSPGQCLHQIQEPSSAEQAAWHAGLDEGRSQAAPAAVAVPDERAAFEAFAREYGTWDIKRDDVPQLGIASYTDVAVVVAWHAWQARAELAAAPAAGELAPLQVGLQEPALVVLPEEIPASNTLWMFLTKGMTQSAIAGMPERDRKVLTERAQENWAAIRAEVGATAPVVLPEPDAQTQRAEGINQVVKMLKKRADAYADEHLSTDPDTGATEGSEAHIEYWNWLLELVDDVRALLAGVSAPAAQAVEPVYTWTGTEADEAMILLGRMDDSLDPERIAQLEQIVPRLGARINALTAQLAAPQAQADARDADGEAFRTAARLGLTLRFYGNCAQSGMPGAPSVYEVTPGPNNAEAMRASIARADAAIAAQAAQQGDAA